MSKSILVVVILSLSFALPFCATAQWATQSCFTSDWDNQWHRGLPSEDLTCEELRKRGETAFDQEQHSKAVATFRSYIESCANDYRSYLKFTDISISASFCCATAPAMSELREWLKSVLYLNPDSNYYCYDVKSIMETFLASEFAGGGKDAKAVIAVVDYLIESGRCELMKSSLILRRNSAFDWMRGHYEDTVTNSELTPYDSTIPTIEDLGLGILRGIQGNAERDGALKLNWLAVPNPFFDQVTVRFEAPHAGFARVELFDLLGQRVSETIQRQIEKGATSFTYPTESLTAGNYMLRIEFDGRQVSTQKIERQ